MPKHPNHSKKACNKEVQQVMEQERVKKTFNTSSNKVYSIVSDNLETIDSLYYKDNMKKEELMKFVNRQIEIEIFGGKKIAGKFIEIEKDEANSEWAIINDAIIDGKPFDIMKTSITDIVSIVDTNRTLTPDLDSDNRTSAERRSTAPSGWLRIPPLSRASRSTTATPRGTPKDSALVCSKSQTDLWRLRSTSGNSYGSSGSLNAAIVKSGSSTESVTNVLAIQNEAQIPQLNAEQEKMVQSGARAKTPTPQPRTPATRPKVPASTSPTETALTPPSNPILAPKFMGITVTNADGERRPRHSRH